MSDSEWINEFYKLYFNSDREKRDEGERILWEHRPKIFCKYMAPNSAGKFLSNFQHWLVHPNQYMLDKKTALADQSDARWYTFPEKEGMTSDEKGIIKFYQQVVLDDPNNILRSSLKVCSFTTNPLDPDMWKNYAEDPTGVQGICVEYDVGFNWCMLVDMPPHLYPMIYCDTPVDLSEFVLNGADPGWDNPRHGPMFLKYFGFLISLLKNAAYSSENEWRAIYYNPLQGNANPICAKFGTPTEEDFEELDNYDIPPDFKWGCHNDHPTYPKNVYLGEKISDELKNNVLNKATSYNFWVYQIIRDGQKLTVEEIYAPDIKQK